MPHKRNPIRSERLTGMARLVRSHAGAALENVALWHERDISHSSVERVILPDACTLTHFMLSEITDLVKNLLVYPENMGTKSQLLRRRCVQPKSATCFDRQRKQPRRSLCDRSRKRSRRLEQARRQFSGLN